MTLEQTSNINKKNPRKGGPIRGKMEIKLKMSVKNFLGLKIHLTKGTFVK